MKKYIKIILASFLSFGIIILASFQTASATSGACSSHGGVNCSAQISRYDKVMCNDGWINSSVYYYESTECQASSCTLPSSSGCQSESDYGALQLKLNASGGYLGMSASGESALNQCRGQISTYQSAYQAYTSCLATSPSNTSTYSSQSSYGSNYVQNEMQKYCVGKYGAQSIYNSTSEACGCASGYKSGKSGQCIPEASYCAERIGSNSYFNTTGQTCSCNAGYTLGMGDKYIYGVSQCTPLVSYCAREYGVDSWLNNEKGTCEWCESNGVKGKKVDGQCVFPVAPLPATTPSVTPIPKSNFFDSLISADTQKTPQAKVELKQKEKAKIKKETISPIPLISSSTPTTTSSLQATSSTPIISPRKQETKKSWFSSTIQKFFKILGL